MIQEILEKIFEDIKSTMITVSIVFIFIYIFSVLGVTFGMQEFTNGIINSLALFVGFIIAIPTTIILTILLFVALSQEWFDSTPRL